MAIVLEPIRRIRMTLEEYEALPEGPPYYDYIRGEAIELNRPKLRHQIVNMCLGKALWDHCRQFDLGIIAPEVNVKLPTGDWVSPDITFLSKQNSDCYDKSRGVIVGAPDLIVEVSSPSTMAYDKGEKLKLYSASKVPWLWYVDQDALALEELQLTPEGYVHLDTYGPDKTFSTHRFPQLSLYLADLIGEETTNGE